MEVESGPHSNMHQTSPLEPWVATQILLSGRWCLWKLDLARIMVSRMNHGCGLEKKVGPKGRKWSQDHTPTCIRLVYKRAMGRYKCCFQGDGVFGSWIWPESWFPG